MIDYNNEKIHARIPNIHANAYIIHYTAYIIHTVYTAY